MGALDHPLLLVVALVLRQEGSQGQESSRPKCPPLSRGRGWGVWAPGGPSPFPIPSVPSIQPDLGPWGRMPFPLPFLPPSLPLPHSSGSVFSVKCKSGRVSLLLDLSLLLHTSDPPQPLPSRWIGDRPRLLTPPPAGAHSPRHSARLQALAPGPNLFPRAFLDPSPHWSLSSHSLT